MEQTPCPHWVAVAGPITQIIELKSWYFAGGLIFIIMGIVAIMTEDVRNIEDSKEPEQARAKIMHRGK